MRAVYINEYGGTDVLEVKEVEDSPSPRSGEVRVKVAAAALNRADILQRRGLYPPPSGYPERIPGLEFAGTVESVGEDVDRFEIGERVFGIIPGGAQAEMLVTGQDQLSRVPAGLELVSAAAIPEAFITAHDAMITQGGLKKGETVLIHAVGSGVGLAALQLANVAGARTIGTSRTNEKLERCEQMGLDVAISAEEHRNFADVVQKATEGVGADVILDLVGAKYLSQNIKSLAVKGRLLLVGLVGGAAAELDMRLVLQKRATLIGTVLRGRSGAEKEEVTSAFERDVIPHLESGAISPNVDRVFPIDEIRDAHEYLESNESFGKVVIRIAGNDQ
ncbi:MAG: NAD(P)H-quinone oxidoreductase [Acidobacteria bacterium]|nr:MAG: NAD(P)H-quinone oxidoreductase [Acidobacteriota bacterium]REK02954.1 MAG: NAD(P)H-quinone oxidoreductase [Acidobacteriota bacterium]REK13242.1 MAG: NAD(P)H-quinone oxidoreductase [Acidobacteriota bacterium]REK41236.1 MAG: NAD(P)H-quinone oxidoreductase [Acidobacteriota bacterium]